MRIVQPVVSTARQITGTVRDMARMREVAQVLAQHGFGAVVANVDIPGLSTADLASVETTPERANTALQALGPTFIKLGQVLSTRPDLLSPAYIEAFQQLQDDVVPVPFEDVRATLVAELGEQWESLVDDFDTTPLATASIAQVHRARLKDGTDVVFKVQRSGIAPKIRSDLNILHFLADRAEAEFPEAKALDVKGVLSEFDNSLRAELDFTAEARHTRRFRVAFAGNPEVRIPDIVEELSTSRVLCIEFLDGVKIRNAREHGSDMTVVGQRYLDLTYTMLFEHGFFHGDLHPGNVLVLDGDVLGVLDFGMVGQLTREMKDAIVSLLFALERADHRVIARIFYDVAVKEERVDYDAFETDVIGVVEKNWSGTSVAEMQIGRFLMDVTQAALRHKVRAPHGYTMFFKALLTTEGLAKALIPEVDPLKAAAPYVQQMIADRYSKERLQNEAFYSLVGLGTLGRRLPVTLSQFLDDLDKQRLTVTVKEATDPERLDAEDRRQNRLIIALFAITAAVCGAMTWEVRPFGDVPVISTVFWLAAAPLFLTTMTMTLRNRG
ncbi:MAG: AarF/ABC1/UbiB kinase family protein [Proteobacteria bacterium]|nr:AarF/ABC1/UbiB kinase family protein [Pseudomonadota bacterium]MCP4920788.1 AarF/ABC1/UbiB kinase family protein [Pseudomonadota bacterium]